MTIMNTAEYYEHLIQIIYELVLEEGDSAIDIGANQGRHTFPMAEKVTSSGKIYSFEPIPMHYHQLLEEIGSGNNACYSAVQVYPYALSDRVCKAEFTVNLGNTALCSGFKENKFVNYERAKKISVECTTIDSMFDELSSPLKFIKIDVDGAELSVLRGAKNTLLKHKPVVVFESGDSVSGSYGYSSLEVYEFFEEITYGIYDVEGKLLDERGFTGSSREQSVWNYVAIDKGNPFTKEKVIEPLRALTRSLKPSENTAPSKFNNKIVVLNRDLGTVLFKNPYEYIDLQIILENSSRLAWPNFSFLENEKGKVNFGMIWSKNGKYITEDRRKLPCTVFPGQQASLKLHFSPNTLLDILDPGSYEVYLNLVQEHIRWFEGGLKLNVTVL